MRAEILKFHDSNMARQKWNWTCFLDRCENGSFSLTLKQELIGPENADEVFVIDPVLGLKRGADIYQELNTMLENIGYDLSNFDLNEIAEGISIFDHKVADEFLRGEKLLERRCYRNKRKEQFFLDAALEPFRQVIDDYCARIDDNRTRGGGGISRPSEKSRVKAFLERYVCQNGTLPIGRHSWTFSNGFLNGSHDFGNLGTSFPKE